MEQEITELLVFIGIMLLIASPCIISQLIDAYKVKKEIYKYNCALDELDKVLNAMRESNINVESKSTFEEIITNKALILIAKKKYLEQV